MRINRLIAFLVFFLLQTVAYGQIISSLSISNDSIRIGDEIEVYYKLTVPQSYQFETIEFSGWDSLVSLVPINPSDTSGIPRYAEIEWRGRIEDLANKQLQYNLIPKTDLRTAYEYRDTFTAEFWDIGIFEFSHPRLSPDSLIGSDQIMYLENPVVAINPPLGIQNPDSTALILPITDILTTEKKWWDKMRLWIFAQALLIILGLLYFFFGRKRKQEQVVVAVHKPKDPSHVIALRKLDEIENEAAWKKGLVKKYQTELTYTIREYLEGRYSVHALESTTDEISNSLKDTDLDASQVSELIQILQIADLVKFAKAAPTDDINEQFLTKAKKFVLETKRVSNISPNQEADG